MGNNQTEPRQSGDGNIIVAEESKSFIPYDQEEYRFETDYNDLEYIYKQWRLTRKKGRQREFLHYYIQNTREGWKMQTDVETIDISYQQAIQYLTDADLFVMENLL